ncbi:hypothetical protein MLD38_010201 [Melastoma candidum]|uniref:Uncharacterized protein n=1 Tax=Melastoma candidum TaxID=119954 RepID=A0ACB9QZ53_9MYRT|nr:hypothetical protein MLD38_010201 [Melastoma candidum]
MGSIAYVKAFVQMLCYAGLASCSSVFNLFKVRIAARKPKRLDHMSNMDESKDPFKGVDWKAVGTEIQKDPGTQPSVRKRLPKKIRQIPEFYFLPKRSLPVTLGIYGACIAGGIGAGMLLEVWINKKVKEDGGGVVWEFGK